MAYPLGTCTTPVPLVPAQLLAEQTNGLVVNVGQSWLRAFGQEFEKEYFSDLANFVASERNKGMVYPPADHVFSWTNHCTLHEVKVVILGQDPYHNSNQAYGMAFGVQKDVTIPPSLENIYKALKKDIPEFKHPGHGDIKGWANQGVLLLNTCLTVNAGQPKSHMKEGWEIFTDAVISWLSANRSNLVFMLWGNDAQKKAGLIDPMKHLVLRSFHPSPQSAYRGFLECSHFSICNAYLVNTGQTPIDWNCLP